MNERPLLSDSRLKTPGVSPGMKAFPAGGWAGAAGPDLCSSWISGSDPQCHGRKPVGIYSATERNKLTGRRGEAEGPPAKVRLSAGLGGMAGLLFR